MTLLQIVSENIPINEIEALTKMSFKIGSRIVIDLVSVFILVRFIYYPIYKHREFFFMFVIFNLIIFLVSFLLNKVELSMGAAFGLFAVFSMLRYRTENISIKDMTYLFLSIAIGLVSAVTKIKGAPDQYEYMFLGGVNAIILLVTFLLESKLFLKKELIKTIIYENIELIQSNKKEEFLADIRKRTGINVHRASVQQINFLKDSAQVKIYYYD
ncbi:MAG TPA: DUF4956 domain-containing protein [Bacteroidia bacterium]|jgi:hypothetical protein|nr:DUF4956 domain-containing protein [Bacteroidia bacterium]